MFRKNDPEETTAASRTVSVLTGRVVKMIFDITSSRICFGKFHSLNGFQRIISGHHLCKPIDGNQNLEIFGEGMIIV